MQGMNAKRVTRAEAKTGATKKIRLIGSRPMMFYSTCGELPIGS